MLSSRFSFLGIGSSSEVNDSLGVSGSKLKPTLSLQTDKDVYRPGDSIFVTIEVGNSPVRDHENVANPSILVEKLSFEVKGVEKLDIHSFITQKPSPGSRGRRGIQGAFLLLKLLYVLSVHGDFETVDTFGNLDVSHIDTLTRTYTLLEVGLNLVNFCSLACEDEYEENG